MPLLFYAVICLWCFGLPTSWTAQYFAGGDSDAYANMWFLNWWPFALAHHVNPFFTSLEWSPNGDDLAWDTSIPLAALIGWPLTASGGVGFTFNVLSLTAPVLSAWTAFLLARYLTRDWAASVVGGYLFGFSTYELGQMVGHLNLEMIWLVPVVVLVALARARLDIGRYGYVFGLAAVLLCQIGISVEIYATMAFFGAILWLMLIAAAAPPLRVTLLWIAAETAVAGLIALLCAAPLLIYMVKGLGNLPGEMNSIADNSTDLSNFIVPTSITLWGQHRFAAVAARFTSNAVEQGAYLGVPLALILIWATGASVRNRMAMVMPAMMLVLIICSLGPVLHVSGHQTGFYLPWALMEHVPLIDGALPIRFTMYVWLGAGLIVARFLADHGRREWRVFKFGAAGLACAALWPDTSNFPWTPLPSEVFFQPAHEKAALGDDARVLILPFGADGPADYWQIESRMQFSQAGGYLGYVPQSEAKVQAVDDLVRGQTDPAFEWQFAAYCKQHGVRYVLIGPGAEPALVAGILAEGWRSRVDAGVTVISVPGGGA